MLLKSFFFWIGNLFGERFPKRFFSPFESWEKEETPLTPEEERSFEKRAMGVFYFFCFCALLILVVYAVRFRPPLLPRFLR